MGSLGTAEVFVSGVRQGRRLFGGVAPKSWAQGEECGGRIVMAFLPINVNGYF